MHFGSQHLPMPMASRSLTAFVFWSTSLNCTNFQQSFSIATAWILFSKSHPQTVALKLSCNKAFLLGVQKTVSLTKYKRKNLQRCPSFQDFFRVQNLSTSYPLNMAALPQSPTPYFFQKFSRQIVYFLLNALAFIPPIFKHIMDMAKLQMYHPAQFKANEENNCSKKQFSLYFKV